MRRQKRKSIPEELLWSILKPPKWLLIASGALLIGSAIFHYDYFFWSSKISAPYTNKVMKIISGAVLPIIPISK